MIIIVIAAVARNGVIGNKGKIPWRLPHDMERFQRLTVGETVIMGRRTWESLPPKFRPLPKRRNIVLTNSRFVAEGADVFTNLSDAIMDSNTEKVYIIGGEQLYKEVLNRANEALITVVDTEPDGDACFEEALELEYNPAWWKVSESVDPKPPEGQPTSRFLWLTQKNA